MSRIPSAFLNVVNAWYNHLPFTDLIPQLFASRSNTLDVDISPPFTMPSDVAELQNMLSEIAAREDIAPTDRPLIMRDIAVNFSSALMAGRLCNKVAILLLGETGQGKSATINKLVGQQLLKTGRNQSTTKGVDSVIVPAVRNGVSVPLSFDDTPGLQDTTVADRDTNAVLFKRYCDSNFSPSFNAKHIEDLELFLRRINHDRFVSSLRPALRKATYPNAILLTSRWDQVKHDACNKPGCFATPMGRAIWALRTSGLYDAERPNVVLVVTRAISDPSDYLDEEPGTLDFNQEWREESALKESIILAIQLKVFPRSKPWPVVFVENGGSLRKFGKYDILPNGEQTHQNLFNVLRDLFDYEDASGARDLLGLHTLATVISGARPYMIAPTETKILEARENIGATVTDTEKNSALEFIGESPNTPLLASKAREDSSSLQPALDDLNRMENSLTTHKVLDDRQYSILKKAFWLLFIVVVLVTLASFGQQGLALLLARVGARMFL